MNEVLRTRLRRTVVGLVLAACLAGTVLSFATIRAGESVDAVLLPEETTR